VSFFRHEEAHAPLPFSLKSRLLRDAPQVYPVECEAYSTGAFDYSTGAQRSSCPLRSFP
jgi:hypothetical protein